MATTYATVRESAHDGDAESVAVCKFQTFADAYDFVCNINRLADLDARGVYLSCVWDRHNSAELVSADDAARMLATVDYPEWVEVEDYPGMFACLIVQGW